MPSRHSHGTLDESMREKIKVLIVDDHPVFRDGLRQCLEARKDIRGPRHRRRRRGDVEGDPHARPAARRAHGRRDAGRERHRARPRRCTRSTPTCASSC